MEHLDKSGSVLDKITEPPEMKLKRESEECKHLSLLRRRAVEVLITLGRITEVEWETALKFVSSMDEL